MIPSNFSPVSSSSSVAGADQPATAPELPGSSKITDVDTHKTIGLDNPEIHGAEAKPLDLYSIKSSNDESEDNDDGIIMIPSPFSPASSSSSVAGAGADQPETAPELPGSSKTAVDTNKTIVLDNPEIHGAAAEPLDFYSVARDIGLQKTTINTLIQKLEVLVQLESLPMSDSRRALTQFVIDNLHKTYSSLPLCGHFNFIRFLAVMRALCESSDKDAFPKNIIGVGSGNGFLEKCFGLMGEVNVKCYDRNPSEKFIVVERAEFPKDIEKCLPDDCSNCVLVSGFPKGYLGPVLSEFIRRGGEMLCTTVESTLFCDAHAKCEDNPDVLNEGIKALREKNGEFFQVELGEFTVMGTPSYIQFYNWPSSVKTSIFESKDLEGLCSDIKEDYYYPLSDSDESN